jgi:hypothetical protein
LKIDRKVHQRRRVIEPDVPLPMPKFVILFALVERGTGDGGLGVTRRNGRHKKHPQQLFRRNGFFTQRFAVVKRFLLGNYVFVFGWMCKSKFRHVV